MKIHPSTYPRNAAAKLRGMTLVEMMVSMGVGILMLTGLSVVFVTSLYSFAGMGNYIAMDQSSHNALDQLTRDIRRSTNLVSCSGTKLVMSGNNGTQLTYDYDAAGHMLTRQVGGGPASTLLTECDGLEFKMYQKSPQSDGTFPAAGTLAQAKSIAVSWKCSRAIAGLKMNTEDMEQAIIVIRNKLAN